jgi:hypothetical protein
MSLILPTLVILLVAIGVYLSYQKNISNTHKIVIAIIAVLILNIAYGYMEKITIAEGFDNSINIETELADEDDGNYDVEESSPDFDSKEAYNNTTTEMDTTIPNKHRGIGELVGSIDYSSSLKHIQNKMDSIKHSGNTSGPSPSPSPTSMKTESFSDAGITQSNVKGTGNVFNPQVIIRNNSQNSDYTKGIPSWQHPTNDLWNDNIQMNPNPVPTASATSSQSKLTCPDPMDQIYKNINDSYSQACQNKLSCGQYPTTAPDNSTEYPYASKVKDISKVYFPGYSFAPPSTWDVPQKRPPACIPDRSSSCPQGVFDRGTPTNVLELKSDGNQCEHENECSLTNVGSILPKFEYQEVYNY